MNDQRIGFIASAQTLMVYDEVFLPGHPHPVTISRIKRVTDEPYSAPRQGVQVITPLLKTHTFSPNQQVWRRRSSSKQGFVIDTSAIEVQSDGHSTPTD